MVIGCKVKDGKGYKDAPKVSDKQIKIRGFLSVKLVQGGWDTIFLSNQSINFILSIVLLELQKSSSLLHGSKAMLLAFTNLPIHFYAYAEASLQPSLLFQRDPWQMKNRLKMPHLSHIPGKHFLPTEHT
jgi:hypothetical protein